jgi:TRAP-type C4-dicarboxylate transport system permease large subunit
MSPEPNLGPLISPSGAITVYAFMAGSSVSVGGLLLSDVIPVLILVVLMLILGR